MGSWIEAKADKSFFIRVPKAAIYALIRDVPTSGILFPGVDRIEDLGAAKFRWQLAERSTAGIKFRGEYVSQYDFSRDDEITFESIDGNMKTKGRWRFVAAGEGTNVSVRVENQIELPVPIPRLLRKPVQMFADREVSSGFEQQFERIKAKLQ